MQEMDIQIQTNLLFMETMRGTLMFSQTFGDTGSLLLYYIG